MKYEIINSITLESFIIPEKDFKILKSIGDFRCKINSINNIKKND